MSRIAKTFAHLKSKGQRGFIPFITAGDPDLDTTRRLVVELACSGATLVELGVPFSDPMADGPVIQRASERALRHGFGISDILEVVADARRETDVPVVLFSYYNPLLQFGAEELMRQARLASLDGVLVTDLVPEEAGSFAATLAQSEVDMIFLVAPTSTKTRLRLVAECASGFIYAVSRHGVTGAQKELSREAESLVSRVRAVSDLPVAVGFGISNSTQVAEVWRYADAAVVGSAIVAEIEKQADAPDLVRHVGEFARSLLPAESNVA